MGKKKVTCYFLLGTILMFLLCGVCSYFFVKKNLEKSMEKDRFESIYSKTMIDFIVPGPSYLQVSELEEDKSNGIDKITPYYETTTAVSINGNNTKIGSVIIFPIASKIDYTPYGSDRILKGEKSGTGGAAIADRTYADKTKCKIGDEVNISIADMEFSFTITGIAEDNTYYNNGTLALILLDNDATKMMERGLKYSAAYIKATDIDICEKYLKSEYKPLSRLKEETDFDSADNYMQHIENFNSADWSKEITNCHANYDSLSIKYQNTDNSMWINIAIMGILIILIISVFNAILLSNESMKQFIKSFIVKKSGTQNDVKAFYRSGILYNMILYIILSIGAYVYLTNYVGTEYIGTQTLNCAVPVGVALFISVMMIGISSSYVEKHYKVKVVKKKDAPEEIHVEIL